MSNFKSGSGDLDFGENENEDEDEDSSEEDVAENSDVTSEREQADTRTQKQASSDADGETDTTSTGGETETSSRSGEQSTAGDTTATGQKYPYFVRRSNVGDERDTRLELHVREVVAEQEAEFRANLANHLDASEVSKTDAREFALLAAFHHPERVAELMEDEGFSDLG